MKYARRNDLIDVEFSGEGEISAIDVSGRESVLSEVYLDTFYVPVTVHEKEIEFSLEDIEKGYVEMGNMIREENEQNQEDYIFEVGSK